MLQSILLTVLLGLGLPALAQDKLKVEPMAPAPAASAAAPAAQGGIQSQNIFEVKRDAPADADYLKQSNGQRNKVQPGNNAPMWRGAAAGMEGVSSLPASQAPEAGVLIQAPVQYPGSRMTTAGEAWRQVRNQWIIPYGGALFLIILGALAIFHFTHGTIETVTPETGRKIERFTPFERSAHWANAIAFVCLAVSGLVMAFGKFFLLPVVGGTLFGWLGFALKNLHNFAGPLFAVSLVIVFFTFVRDNWPRAGDLEWLVKGAGLIEGKEVPSHRFNAGEKIVFWGGVFFLGVIVVASGLVMDKLIPNLVYDRAMMQVTHMIHSVATVLMMSLFLIHIYLGTIGMRGAYQGMRSGYVDESWAKEHHEHWYDDVKAGKIPAQRGQPTGPGGDVGADTARA